MSGKPQLLKIAQQVPRRRSGPPSIFACLSKEKQEQIREFVSNYNTLPYHERPTQLQILAALDAGLGVKLGATTLGRWLNGRFD